MYAAAFWTLAHAASSLPQLVAALLRNAVAGAIAASL